MAKQPITLQLEPELIAAVDDARGDVARQEWIAIACRERLAVQPQIVRRVIGRRIKNEHLPTCRCGTCQPVKR